MSELFLIAHRVRGEPAFDVAVKIRCGICSGVGGHNVPDFETGVVTDYEGSDCAECEGTGHWWIIPTSGHRAYPWDWIEITRCGEWTFWLKGSSQGMFDVPSMPSNWPDHYPSSPREDAAILPDASSRERLAALGLLKPKAPSDLKRL